MLAAKTWVYSKEIGEAFFFAMSSAHHPGLKVMCIFVIFQGLTAAPKAPVNSEWQHVAAGMELRRITPSPPNLMGNLPIIVLRMNPDLWELSFVGVTNTSESENHTARAWAESYHLTAAINAGMFDRDGKTHLGYVRSQGQVSNSKVNDYRSVAAFDPRDPKLPGFRIFDLDSERINFQGILKDYA